ncbi:MAG: hypothetical protein ACXAE3_11095 [Candidatus Kariarchaeaceae archaeon]|jgi:hypothetical protein
MADLKKIGMILVLIDGILAILGGVLGLVGAGLGFSLGAGVGGSLLGATVGALLAIVVGAVMVMLYLERISIGDAMVTGIVVIVLGVLFTTWLAIIGGILIIVDGQSS